MAATSTPASAYDRQHGVVRKGGSGKDRTQFGEKHQSDVEVGLPGDGGRPSFLAEPTDLPTGYLPVSEMTPEQLLDAIDEVTAAARELRPDVWAGRSADFDREALETTFENVTFHPAFQAKVDASGLDPVSYLEKTNDELVGKSLGELAQVVDFDALAREGTPREISDLVKQVEGPGSLSVQTFGEFFGGWDGLESKLEAGEVEGAHIAAAFARSLQFSSVASSARSGEGLYVHNGEQSGLPVSWQHPGEMNPDERDVLVSMVHGAAAKQHPDEWANRAEPTADSSALDALLSAKSDKLLPGVASQIASYGGITQAVENGLKDSRAQVKNMVAQATGIQQSLHAGHADADDITGALERFSDRAGAEATVREFYGTPEKLNAAIKNQEVTLTHVVAMAGRTFTMSPVYAACANGSVLFEG